MRFTDDFIDEIKARLRPSEVIGRRVKLRRQGREFAGLSPFNKEKTPSFFVNDEKGFYHCFSSGKHGDIFSFLQETEGMSFPEAVEALAGEAGLALPAPDPKAERRAEQRNTLLDWITAAQAFYEAALRRAYGKEARAYLERRGLKPDEWKRFGIGYAPDQRTALKDELVAKGAKPAELVEAGLLIQPDDGGSPYDRFRGRVMFPIHDARGRLVSFGGRALSKEARAKYLNGPDTPLFHKGMTLYRYTEARKAANDPKASMKNLIVVEGYLDAIACVRAGVGQAVAPLGTALTEDQMKLAWRVGGEPLLCFDGDNAGRRAAFRVVERALPLLEPGKSLRFIHLDEGNDPDDLLREEGPAALKRALEGGIPLVDMVWRREYEAEPLETPEARAGLKRRLFEAVGEIKDDSVREQYRAELLSRFDALTKPARPQARNGGTGRPWTPRRPMEDWERGGPTGELKARAGKKGGAELMSRALLYAAIERPELSDLFAEELIEMEFADAPLARLRDALIESGESGETLDIEGLRSHFARLGLSDRLGALDSERRLLLATFSGDLSNPEKASDSWRRAYEVYASRRAAEEERAHARRAVVDDPSEKSLERFRSARSLQTRPSDEAEPDTGRDSGFDDRISAIFEKALKKKRK